MFRLEKQKSRESRTAKATSREAEKPKSWRSKQAKKQKSREVKKQGKAKKLGNRNPRKISRQKEKLIPPKISIPYYIIHPTCSMTSVSLLAE